MDPSAKKSRKRKKDSGTATSKKSKLSDETSVEVSPPLTLAVSPGAVIIVINGVDVQKDLFDSVTILLEQCRIGEQIGSNWEAVVKLITKYNWGKSTNSYK